MSDKKLKYEKGWNGAVTTPCPRYSNIMIHSLTCCKCAFYYGENVLKKYVICGDPSQSSVSENVKGGKPCPIRS
jgi:hypothetical protein